MSRISEREKIYLLAGIICVAVYSFYLLLIDPAQVRTKRLNSMISQRTKEIKEIKNLKGELKLIKGEFSKIENRLKKISKNFSGLTFIETIARKSNVRDYITSIKPQAPIDAGKYKGTSMEIKIEGLPLSKIIEYLYRIENSEYWMKISKLTLKKKFNEQENFSARVTVVSFAKT